MKEEYSRTAKLIGENGVERLKNASCIVFGVGGVGSYAVEALARAGVGRIALVDNDTVAPSNINRQLIALHSTVGKSKCEVARDRIRDIDETVKVEIYPIFFDESTVGLFDFAAYDFVLDCIDSVKSKILLIKSAREADTKIISSMGTGNKLCPERLEIEDISKTSYCPLARAVRAGLKKEGITSLTVVYSQEPPVKSEGAPASISFVPSSAGLLMASFVIRELIK